MVHVLVLAVAGFSFWFLVLVVGFECFQGIKIFGVFCVDLCFLVGFFFGIQALGPTGPIKL